MSYELCNKKLRNRFGFPSGVIATTPDTARWMLNNIPQLGFYVGKSTTLEPQEGYAEDILIQETPDSLRNAVGYANPGLEATIESFKELKESVAEDIFLMPQIGESNEERFAYCATAFDKITIDGIELNLSCPHAKNAGILVGSDPKIVYSIIHATRKATKKPLFVKLNASVLAIEEIARAAVAAGTDGFSIINTLGGPHSELSNHFGGLSGSPLYSVTYETVQKLKKFRKPMIIMGGIRDAHTIRALDSLTDNLFYAIGTALKGLRSAHIQHYFTTLEKDLKLNTNDSTHTINTDMLMNYKPYVVKDVTELNDTVKIISFYETLVAEPGQFVFLKLGDSSKPFSVAQDKENLEILVKKVGPFTAKAFDLKKNDVVRIRGPYGKPFSLPPLPVVFVGAGSGIAPVYHAVTHHSGTKYILLGAKSVTELAYYDTLKNLGSLTITTEDGSAGFQGYLTDILHAQLKQWNVKDVYFFNCGPELMLKKADEIERKYTTPYKIYHLVERMTSCGIGICGKCAIPNGKRLCVDGPVFEATEFSPGAYTRDKTGKKIHFANFK